MKTDYIIVTDPDKFTDVEITVQTELFTHFGQFMGIKGIVSIQQEDGTWKDFQGEHGVNDYEQEYGFKILP